MNTRSLRFQLTLWYAGWLACVLAVVCVGAYLVVRTYLIASLKDTHLRRVRQISQLLQSEQPPATGRALADLVENRFAPGFNNRFLRILGDGGRILYVSGPPQDHSFEPRSVAPPGDAGREESVHVEALDGGRRMLVACLRMASAQLGAVVIESGASMDAVDGTLRQMTMGLGLLLPVVTLIAATGGYLLVKRSLAPVSAIAASASRISSQNLGERLPVPRTGDEVESLSIALNHMITRLDEAFQYSRRFVADASHELRTPLTVLRGELEALLQIRHLDSTVRDTIASLLEETERQANIVEGLFALSRLDAGEAQREWVAFDLGELAASTADQMNLLAEDKRIALRVEGESGVKVTGDPGRLKQVIVNLLDNAIKYTPSEGVITLRVLLEGDHPVLEVCDTGIGIPEEAMPHLFERFFRVDKARSREQGGAGLGLSIVKSICSAHDAAVTVRSHLGRGSVFRVQFPAAHRSPNPAVAPR
jgi:heavy metal sensor kinase